MNKCLKLLFLYVFFILFIPGISFAGNIPTNEDLLKEIKELKEMVKKQSQRINVLENMGWTKLPGILGDSTMLESTLLAPHIQNPKPLLLI